MKPRFEGKVALITGGGTGIGAATARRLAEEGARVVVTGRRAGPIGQVAAEIGGIAVAGDTADEAHLAEAVAAAVKHFGGLDILVANAAQPVHGSVEEVTLEDFRHGMTINVEGVVLAVRAAIPEMRKRGGGSIVLVSSVAALFGAPHHTNYVTTKTALLGLNRCLAYDYGPEKIRSNVICPGMTKSEMMDGALEMIAAAKGCTTNDLLTKLTRSIPLRRGAAAEEIAASIAFLASDDASFVTGAVLVADGGCAVVDSASLAFVDD